MQGSASRICELDLGPRSGLFCPERDVPALCGIPQGHRLIALGETGHPCAARTSARAINGLPCLKRARSTKSDAARRAQSKVWGFFPNCHSEESVMARFIRLCVVFVFVTSIITLAVLVGWADIGNRAELSSMFTFMGLVVIAGLALHSVLFADDIRHLTRQDR